ncbi:hypothetical protein J2X54_001736 [Duganella sp. 3397]|uniref:hypothetical protein n=1 Tax=Duganella sp. 3397 TaxID=2817732 RepID=UPI002863084E|nr:hypothetical protein [Duganella sp. 3397]MDR7049288.1 hypothetical protein [Duganella sp. 3397]
MLNRHVLYLSNDTLTAWRWERGRLLGGASFTSDSAGVDDLLDHLDHQRQVPVLLLTDLIEEDFQRVHLPHVGGRAGAKLTQRRLLQQYRETPFRHHEVQGREPDGRRDDIVLLSALTNPAMVLPWVEALEQERIPLAGLYSTTLLSEYLVNKLGLLDEHLLLVTQQSAGWRQSYFQRGQLKFSRLTPAIDRDGDAINVGAEAAKTQQFLTSVRLLARGSVLETVIIAPAGQLPALEMQCADGPETAFRFLPLAQVTDRLGVSAAVGDAAGALADTMLLALLATTQPASHYTLGPLRRYFQLWRARRNLYLAAGAVAGIAACAVGLNLWQAWDARADSERLAQEARQFDRRYNEVMAAMPPRVTSTANMRAAVNVERMLVVQGPSPWQMVSMVSAALEQSPQIRLLQLGWKVDLPGQPPTGAPVLANGSAGGTGTAAATPMSSLLAGIPARPPQSLSIEAEILSPEDDYRNAVNTMNRFARQLAANPRLLVQVDKPPLDTRPTVRLDGKAGTTAAPTRARFTLNLVWKP